MKRPDIRRFLPLVLLFAAIGCDDDTGTEPGSNTLGDFQPAQVAGTVEEVVTPANASAHPSMVMSEIVLQLDFADAAWDGSIPEEFLGATLVYEPTEQRWVIDESRTGGPEDGMRVIWYTMDQFGAPTVPMLERGHIDVTPAQVDGMNGLALEYVQAADDRVLAQLVQGIRVREEAGIQVREVRIDGTLSGSTSSSQVSLVSVDSITDADSSQYYAYDLLLEGTTGYYDWEISGTSDLDTGAFNETLDIAVGSDGVETRLDLDTEGEGENSLDGAGTLVHDGDKVADVTIRETRFTFTGPDGDGFTAQATFDLEQVTYSLMVEGAFVTIGLLPLLRQL